MYFRPLQSFSFISRSSTFSTLANISSLPFINHVTSYPKPQTPVFDSKFRDFLVHRYCDSSSFNEAKQLHIHIYKHGFHADLYLVNTLINVYVRARDLICARQLFDEMSDRNLVSWACLISGYTQCNMFCAACVGFRDMVSAGLMPNHYAICSVLRACQGLGSDYFRFGLQVHGMISKTWFSFDVLVSNVLITMYGSCGLGSLDYARRVFEGIDNRNLASWNSIISVHSKRRDTANAFRLFSEMQKEGLGFTLQPNVYTLGSLVTAASSVLHSGSCLDQLLCRVQKSGFLDDLYVGSALVSGFSKCGLTASSWKIFEKMSVKNAVTLNGLMVGLVNQTRGEEAVNVFKEVNHLVDVNADTCVVLLSAFAVFHEPREGRRKGKELHAYAIRSGLVDLKVAVGNALVTMYGKCKAVDYATAVFEDMQERDLISWNSLISLLDQNEFYEDAVKKFFHMRRTGLTPANFSLISCLSSCASLGWTNEGTQIHSDALKYGLDSDVSVSNSLLSFYAATECLEDCKKLYLFMPEHDQISWNSMITALASSEASASEAVMYFLQMLRLGLSLSDVTFVSILSAVSSLSFLGLVPQLHALVFKYCSANDTKVENALITCYGKHAHIEECESLFSRMAERRDEVSWNAMISSYIHNEQLSNAMDLVQSMIRNGRRLDHFIFATVLSACASVATLERGMEVHACEIRAGLESNVVVGSAIVDMYAKCGRIDYASRFFERMPVKNVYSWNSMITGYARHGDVDKALENFDQMKKSGQPPNHVTFVGVLSACSHAGMVDTGFRHFEAMSNEYGLTPQMEHFSCMVDLLGRSGKLDKVEDFIEKMPMNPNAVIWRTVLGSCCLTNGRNTDLGKRAAEMLMQLEPENAVNYVLLSNMYASGAKWENMANARSVMRLAGTKKETGRSWVTMKDGVHVFVSGDTSHPEKDAIYGKLKEIQKKMRDAGYVPQASSALYDLELESKEEVLSYHSEKLALAFVLTRKSSSTIRIMKNLRVCGDCHLAFRYVSKIVDRKIVLRDSNRFHHFSDGSCSCGDYW